MKKKQKKWTAGQIILNVIFIIASLTFILPLVLMLSISFSSEDAITKFGYTLFPKVFSVEGYKAVFHNPKQILDSYKVTAIVSFASTVLAMLVQTAAAYPLTRSNYKMKKPITFYYFASMYFSGGLAATYIMYTRYLHIDDTIWVYILPGLMSVWNVFVFRTFFKGLPNGLVEAAKIDGASEYRIYLQVILPLSVPAIASYGFMHLVGKWNSWMESMLYIRNNELYLLQYLLQKILKESEFLENLAKTGESTQGMTTPTETMRYAMAVLASGPMMFVFPFFQKYFAKGMTIGSVKG